MLGELAFRVLVWLELYHPFAPERCRGCEYAAVRLPRELWPPMLAHPRDPQRLSGEYMQHVDPLDPEEVLERWPEATLEAMRYLGRDPMA